MPHTERITSDPVVSGVGSRGAAPETIAPQLATLSRAAPTGDDWLHEIKFDGYRMIAHVASGKTRFYSRNELDWTGRFPELSELLAALPVREAIFDGEVVHMKPAGVTSFGGLQDDLSRKHTTNLIFMAFDLMYLDGWRLTDAPLIIRKSLLARVMESAKDTRLRYSEHQIGNGPQFFAAAAAIPLEGIVSKQASAPYRSGRGTTWLKTKALGREELIVIGFTDPEKSRVGFGSLMVGYFNPTGELTYAGKVGTGYSQKVLLSLRNLLDKLATTEATVSLPKGISRTGVHWVKPSIVIETEFTEWTSDGVLRHPSFLGIREDKAAQDVVLEKALNPNAATSKWANIRKRPMPKPPINLHKGTRSH